MDFLRPSQRRDAHSDCDAMEGGKPRNEFRRSLSGGVGEAAEMVCQETVARVERHEQRGFKPVKWLLTQCGVIPINRVKDNPRAMRTIADSWLHERRALDLGIPHS